MLLRSSLELECTVVLGGLGEKYLQMPASGEVWQLLLFQ